ncbi:MAG: DEAD/DEAH box helicase [Roseibacillus sp.]|nr:DEAD/DEAH box helicase [Roseibacillus sp.]
MQQEGLGELQRLINQGASKALVISATGTGKTYLAAFFVKNQGAKRVLFVVHRERIARQAMASFKEVLGQEFSYGLCIGSYNETDKDMLFSTVQTLSRPERLSHFSPHQFDCIIVDESHRAGASSYKRFLDHFRPKFLLGMTATPERTDGLDIFPLFDHNVAFEIRLQRALKEGMLCSFHYYGVSDLSIDGEIVDDSSDFNRLTAGARVDHIVRMMKRYGCCSDRVRGLIFCSRNDEAKRLSMLLNEKKIRTLSLSGTDDEKQREDAILRLEAEPDDPNGLDYILTVDIFNEGVDIPSVNQVVMLRPTQSAIIFVQQLGRGLRLVEGENKFLTVIDFIGNYERNFLIPAALYGDTSGNKDNLRRRLVAGDSTIPGTSSVNFDRISKERIFESINKAKNTGFRELKAEFMAMQQRLGRVPLMMDWHRLGGRDPRLFAAASNASYAHFVERMDEQSIQDFSANMRGAMEVWAKGALNGDRDTFFGPVGMLGSGDWF